MPRPKRHVRVSGVARSLGAPQSMMFRCLCCGRRDLPRDAIAHIGRKKFHGLPKAFCGECWSTGRVWRDPWVVELELEAKARATETRYTSGGGGEV